MSEMISLDYVESKKLLIPDEKSILINLVGCGGTGSWLAPAVARLAKVLIEHFHKQVKVNFYDPDRVEEKNIYRQNFCAAEIGKYKAESLATRYGLAWGVDIQAVNRALNGTNIDFDSDLVVFLGCVDNFEGRKFISSYKLNNAWWIDSGNTRNQGQILIGALKKRPKGNLFKFEGFCTWLPSPAEQHPELVQALKIDEMAPEQNLSCAEMALLDSQGLTINQRMAAEAADYLMRLLITKDLTRYATYIDLESGTTRSKYITEKEIRRMG